MFCFQLAVMQWKFVVSAKGAGPDVPSVAKRVAAKDPVDARVLCVHHGI